MNQAEFENLVDEIRLEREQETNALIDFLRRRLLSKEEGSVE